MKAPAPSDLQRWSEEVARDPKSLAFLPLARAYRKQGRRDAALRICLRGLEHHPTHVEAHSLLALLYFESGQRARAYDEWSIVLRLDSANFEAIRGMGFYYLEQGDDRAARENLTRAESMKPGDVTVREALKILNERNADVFAPPAQNNADAWDSYIGALSPAPNNHHRPATPVSAAPRRAGNGQPPAVPVMADPRRVFDEFIRGGQILGGLILDQQGLVLGGSLANVAGTTAETVGAILNGAIEEAARTASLLSLGQWCGILLDAETAQVYLSPLDDGMVLLVAARRDAPLGWVLRSAQQASTVARKFLEAYA